MTQLATQAGKTHAEKPADGLREIRCFMRGVYQGHQIIFQRRPAKKDALPEEQDESFVVDVHECHELLQRHLDIATDSPDDEKRMGTIATEYARHRRRIRLCLAGLNHQPESETATPQATITPPLPASTPEKTASSAPQTIRQPATPQPQTDEEVARLAAVHARRGVTRTPVAQSLHKTPEAPIDSGTSDADGDFTYDPAATGGNGTPEQPADDAVAFEDIGVDPSALVRKPQRKAPSKP